MATIWRELDTGLAIGPRQRRGNVPAATVEEDKECVTRSSGQYHARCGKRISVEVSSRRISQTEDKDISDHDLKSKEEEEEDK
ncbi:hypothetical protein DSO57_1010652 [Entomophthora muscae]|uniref:Uncharacterized protein n=1 Tax=Entomophthora muscae TaxID=34485 RepID=A0ACC2RXK6_9FUNG|nr:hypothetical protein DSO57_1010652 [Entomophthora muscae]